MIPLKILYFSSFGSMKGGGQKSLLLIFKHIDQNKFIPLCAIPQDGLFVDRLKDEGIKNFIIPLGPTKSVNIPRIIKTIFKIYRLIRSENISLIHTDSPRSTFYAGVAAKFSRIPLISHVRVVDEPRFDDKVMSFLSDAFIFVSKSAQSRFAWMSGKVPSYVIYNGIDEEDFKIKYQQKKNAERISENSQTGHSIGCIGRVEKEKGQEFLLQAALKIIEKFPDTHFYFIGECENSYARGLQEDFYHLGNHIEFTGYLNDPYSIMKDMDLIVLPSLTEGFSRTILEAMAMKKPIIAADVGGNSEAINNGITGYLVPPRDPVALSDKIVSLLNDRQKCKKMGLAGYHRAIELFNIDNNVEKIEELYYSLLSNP